MSNIYDALSKKKEQDKGEPGAAAALTPLIPSRSGVPQFPNLLHPSRDRELESLRRRILMDLGSNQVPILVFTGAVPGEGATTLALHFARELAEGERGLALLVDGDLQRSPHSLSSTLAASKDLPLGFTDVLAGRAELSSAVLGTELPNLHFLPCGQDLAAPMDLVRPDRVEHVLQEMARHYAFVVIDSGAPLEAAEAALLASATSGVVMVVRANRTRREVVQRAVQVLTRSRCRILGVVLNDRRYPIPGFLYRRV
jgi:capsular exopolysaccharide synthesis family protein